jgi:hypothetical protein
MTKLTEDVRGLIAGKRLTEAERNELRAILDAAEAEEDNVQVILSIDCDVPKSKLQQFRQASERELEKLATWAQGVVGTEGVRATVATYGVDDDE